MRARKTRFRRHFNFGLLEIATDSTKLVLKKAVQVTFFLDLDPRVKKTVSVIIFQQAQIHLSTWLHLLTGLCYQIWFSFCLNSGSCTYRRCYCYQGPFLFKLKTGHLCSPAFHAACAIHLQACQYSVCCLLQLAIDI